MSPDEIRVLRDTFHEYKNPLMRFRFGDLLQQREVVDDQHIAVFKSALLRHPRAAAKIGCGVLGFFARRTTAKLGDKGTVSDVCCMHVRRLDGSEEDFSIYAGGAGEKSRKKASTFDSATGRLVPKDDV